MVPVLLWAMSTDKLMALPLLIAVVDVANPTVPVLRWAVARLWTKTEWVPALALVPAVAVKALVLELLTVMLV
jgi:hypothetical protein